MENKKGTINEDKDNKILKTKIIKNSSKQIKEKKEDKNNRSKYSYISYIERKKNLMIYNKFEDNKNKNGETSTIKTLQNSQKNKNQNSSAKCLKIHDKKEQNKKHNLMMLKKLNLFYQNGFNEDNFLTKRYKNNNFSDVKVKKIKSNFNSILLNFKKENKKYQYGFNNIKTKVNKNNKYFNFNNSIISNGDGKIENDKNKKGKSKKNDTNNKIKKDKYKDIHGIYKENFKSFTINKYSSSFVNDPFQIERKFNIFNNVNKKSEKYLNNSKKKIRNVTKSFEDKRHIEPKVKNSFNAKINFKLKIDKKKYNFSLISKKLKKIKDNNYQMTEYSSSFNKTLPIKINKINFKNKNKGNINSIGRINSHKILITNININLYKDKENVNNFFMNSDENRNNSLNFKTEIISEENNIDLEKVYLLEEKVLKILKKINDYTSCDKECLDWTDFYFDVKFYDRELILFKKINNYKKMINYAKLEIICYFLCYDISLNQNYSKASILLKTIINILHQNYLILMVYFLYLNNNSKISNSNNNNDLWKNKIEKVIEKELKINLSVQDMNEDSIMSLYVNSIKNILNYYEMIINNLYSLEENEVYNDNIFQNCLTIKETNMNKEKKSKIISVFFSRAYKSLNNYSFEDIKIFFDIYISNQKYSFINKNKNQRFNENNNQINKKEKEKEKQFYYLAPIKPKYKYTLIINLDETLIYNNNSKIILFFQITVIIFNQI